MARPATILLSDALEAIARSPSLGEAARATGIVATTLARRVAARLGSPDAVPIFVGCLSGRDKIWQVREGCVIDAAELPAGTHTFITDSDQPRVVCTVVRYYDAALPAYAMYDDAGARLAETAEPAAPIGALPRLTAEERANRISLLNRLGVTGSTGA